MVSLKNFWVRCTKLRGKRQGSGQHESINIFFGSPFLEQLLECRGLNSSTCRTHCPTAPPYPYNERFSFSRKELHTSMKFDRLGEPVSSSELLSPRRSNYVEVSICLVGGEAENKNLESNEMTLRNSHCKKIAKLMFQAIALDIGVYLVLTSFAGRYNSTPNAIIAADYFTITNKHECRVAIECVSIPKLVSIAVK